jgi:YD repeat-containing protein
VLPPACSPSIFGSAGADSFDYDPAHRRTASRDPLGHETRTGYDANGNVASTEQDITTGRVARSTVDYDQRDAPVTITQRLDAATNRNVVSRIEYDPNGNRTRLISPRANDAASGTAPFTNYVTAFTYDAANRLTRITLPFDGRDGTERRYLHRAYDAGGNLLWASLPVTSASATSVQDSARTAETYFDPGWIRSSKDPTNPKVRFDYTAEGLQAERTPERKDQPGIPDTGRRMTWAYFADTLLKQRTDQGGQAAIYAYDANNNLTSATSGSGLTDPGERPVDTQASYTGFDEPAKTRLRKQGAARYRCRMSSLVQWASSHAEGLLGPLGNRWAHVQAVAEQASRIAPAVLPPAERETLIVAAWLHDIGYAPALASTGLHPLDGAQHLGGSRRRPAALLPGGPPLRRQVRGRGTRLRGRARRLRARGQPGHGRAELCRHDHRARWPAPHLRGPHQRDPRALPARPSGSSRDQPLAPHAGRRGRADHAPARRRRLGRV